MVVKMAKVKYRLMYIVAALVCCAALFTCIAGSAGASQIEWVEPITAVCGNAALDFGVAPIADEAEEYATSMEEAAEIFREQLRDRKEYAVVYWRTLEYGQTTLNDMFDLAVAHTGNPTEGDYISRQYNSWSAKLSGYVQGNVYYLTLEYTIEYYTTADQEVKVDAAVEKILKQLDLKNATDYQKVKGVYDWLCQNVTYDYDHLEDTTYLRKHSTYAALIDHTAVCQGYATAMYRLLLELGVDVRYVGGWSYDDNGQMGAHGWNIVKLGQKYYNLDATWDATYSQLGYSYQCFLKNDAEFTYHKRNNAEYDFVNSNAYPIADNSYVNERFTVKFVDYDGRVLSKNTYTFGAKIEKPKDPQRAFANGIRYTFLGWDREVGLCDGDQVFVAQYQETYVQHHVYFKNDDGTELAHQIYLDGETIVAPKDPVRLADNTYTYRFSGWDKEVGICTGDQVFTATYEKTYINYTIQFMYEDGTLIAEGTYHYGDSVTAPKEVTPLSGEELIFIGWDTDVTKCYGNKVYIAQFVVPADRGDFDGDRIVSNSDVIYLLWYTMFPDSYPIYESADYNADGDTNNQDVIHLLWHTMFPESYPLQ